MATEGFDGVRARLRLLATTDLHVHLLPYDYYADRPLAATGLAQAARLIRSLRQGAGTCLLLDNGDFLQGNLLSDWLAGEGRGSEPVHPMIAAMNALGFDAGTLGNHEFNYGLGYLSEALSRAAFPLVSANVLAVGEGDATAPLLAPWAILAREVEGSDGRPHPIRVGVVGFAPPQTALRDREGLGGRVATRDVVEAARAEVPRLRAAGADLVVALCHSGIGAERAEPLMENAAVPLAAVPGIDALVAGHTHVTFPGPGVAATGAVDPVAGTIHGKPAVQPGFFGSHVGVLDLDLGRDEGGAWRVLGHAARAERVARRAAPDGPFANPPIDEAVAAIAEPSHRRVIAMARRPVGVTEVALQTYFSLVAADAALDVVADAQRRFARELLAGTPQAGLPLLVAVAPFRAGGRGGPLHYVDVPPGPVALRQAAELYVHPNSFAVVEVTGADLLDWIERSASMFRRLRAGFEDQPLLDPGFPSYNFDVIDGLSYLIDPTRPARTDAEGRLADPGAARVADLRHEGRPVAPGDRFALATNSYRLGSGGGFGAATRARPLAQSARAVGEVVLDHVRAGPLRPRPRPRWRFAPLPGTGAWFDTGPGALGHPGGAEGRDVRPLGPAPGGFWRFAIRL